MDFYDDISSDSALSEDYNMESICPVCDDVVNPYERNRIEKDGSLYHGYCVYKICCKHIRAHLNRGILNGTTYFEYKGRLYCDMPCAAKKTHAPYTEFPHCRKCKEILLQDTDVRHFGGFIFHNSCMSCSICKVHLLSGENILVLDDGSIKHKHKSPCTTKNKRTVIHPYQKKALLQHYSTNKHPTNAQLEIISKQLNVSVNVCKVWFQNQRARVG